MDKTEKDEQQRQQLLRIKEIEDLLLTESE